MFKRLMLWAIVSVAHFNLWGQVSIECIVNETIGGAECSDCTNAQDSVFVRRGLRCIDGADTVVLEGPIRVKARQSTGDVVLFDYRQNPPEFTTQTFFFNISEAAQFSTVQDVWLFLKDCESFAVTVLNVVRDTINWGDTLQLDTTGGGPLPSIDSCLQRLMVLDDTTFGITLCDGLTVIDTVSITGIIFLVESLLGEYVNDIRVTHGFPSIDGDSIYLVRSDTSGILDTIGIKLNSRIWPPNRFFYSDVNGLQTTLDAVIDSVEFRAFLARSGLLTASGNIAWGINAMASGTNQAINNIGIGQGSLEQIDTGQFNVAIGFESLNNIIGGRHNIGIGYRSGFQLDTGGYNIAVGWQALRDIDSSFFNIGIGPNAGPLFKSGMGNIFIGRNTASSIDTGSMNVFLGYQAGSSVTMVDSSVFIGPFAGHLYTDSLPVFYLSNDSTDQPLIFGSFRFDSILVNSTLSVRDVPHLDSPDSVFTVGPGHELRRSAVADLQTIDTDDQTVETFTFDNGTRTLTIALEDDGEPNYIVNIPTGDTDQQSFTYDSTTALATLTNDQTASPDLLVLPWRDAIRDDYSANYSDSIRHNGNVGINLIPLHPLDVANSDVFQTNQLRLINPFLGVAGMRFERSGDGVFFDLLNYGSTFDIRRMDVGGSGDFFLRMDTATTGRLQHYIWHDEEGYLWATDYGLGYHTPNADQSNDWNYLLAPKADGKFMEVSFSDVLDSLFTQFHIDSFPGIRERRKPDHIGYFRQDSIISDTTSWDSLVLMNLNDRWIHLLKENQTVAIGKGSRADLMNNTAIGSNSFPWLPDTNATNLFTFDVNQVDTMNNTITGATIMIDSLLSWGYQVGDMVSFDIDLTSGELPFIDTVGQDRYLPDSIQYFRIVNANTIQPVFYEFDSVATGTFTMSAQMFVKNSSAIGSGAIVDRPFQVSLGDTLTREIKFGHDSLRFKTDTTMIHGQTYVWDSTFHQFIPGFPGFNDYDFAHLDGDSAMTLVDTLLPIDSSSLARIIWRNFGIRIGQPGWQYPINTQNFVLSQDIDDFGLQIWGYRTALDIFQQSRPYVWMRNLLAEFYLRVLDPAAEGPGVPQRWEVGNVGDYNTSGVTDRSIFRVDANADAANLWLRNGFISSSQYRAGDRADNFNVDSLEVLLTNDGSGAFRHVTMDTLAAKIGVIAIGSPEIDTFYIDNNDILYIDLVNTPHPPFSVDLGPYVGGGADSMGRVLPVGVIPFGQGNKLPNYDTGFNYNPAGSGILNVPGIVYIGNASSDIYGTFGASQFVLGYSTTQNVSTSIIFMAQPFVNSAQIGRVGGANGEFFIRNDFGTGDMVFSNLGNMVWKNGLLTRFEVIGSTGQLKLNEYVGGTFDGGGNRFMVVDDATGLVYTTSDITGITVDNLYNVNGTLQANRTVLMDGKTLTFQGGTAASPLIRLQSTLADGSPKIQFLETDADFYVGVVGNLMTIGGGNAETIRMETSTGNDNALYIDAAGFVGIHGQTDPSAYLDILGPSGAAKNVFIEMHKTGGWGQIFEGIEYLANGFRGYFLEDQFARVINQKATSATNGRVGIYNNDPSFTLDIGKNGSSSGNLRVAGGSQFGLPLESSLSNFYSNVQINYDLQDKDGSPGTHGQYLKSFTQGSGDQRVQWSNIKWGELTEVPTDIANGDQNYYLTSGSVSGNTLNLSVSGYGNVAVDVTSLAGGGSSLWVDRGSYMQPISEPYVLVGSTTNPGDGMNGSDFRIYDSSPVMQMFNHTGTSNVIQFRNTDGWHGAIVSEDNGLGGNIRITSAFNATSTATGFQLDVNGMVTLGHDAGSTADQLEVDPDNTNQLVTVRHESAADNVGLIMGRNGAITLRGGPSLLINSLNSGSDITIQPNDDLYILSAQTFIGGGTESSQLEISYGSNFVQLGHDIHYGSNYLRYTADNETGGGGVQLRALQGTEADVNIEADNLVIIKSNALGSGNNYISLWGAEVHIGDLPGNASGTFALEVTGNAWKSTGGTTWAGGSDRRWKKNIHDISGLEKIMKLRPVTFEYNDLYHEMFPNSGSEGLKSGFIAQEYRDIFPEDVQEGNEGFLFLAPDSVVPHAVAAIQELEKENSEMKENINALIDQIKKLNERITDLENR